jgi:hypothetical protein
MDSGTGADYCPIPTRAEGTRGSARNSAHHQPLGAINLSMGDRFLYNFAFLNKPFQPQGPLR